ncbi:alpha/beta fold hydrolase [Dechloromonas sp. A34]|uniref:alpha/beta fold hydrolase n=1 Tax=Dechloromonas sp. A34 TaxID=447588 RepID=UPI002248C6A2|nr:alpha/beta hydrolase [Dechloromonas sp. A34]
MSAWILLRGLTRESRHWGDFPERLQSACGAARVQAIDLPGNGRLHGQESPLLVADMARSCRRQLRELGIAPPYFVLAMSLGAMVAVDWATRQPMEIAGCVLINTSLRPFSPFYHRLQPSSYWSLLDLLLRGGDAESRERTILQLTSSHPPAPEIFAAWAGYARQCPVSTRNALRQLLAAARYTAPATRPAPPMLVLSGAHDRLVDPRCSRRLAAQWATAFAEHPTAGHDLPLDDGTWVARQVGHWRQMLAARD